MAAFSRLPLRACFSRRLRSEPDSDQSSVLTSSASSSSSKSIFCLFTPHPDLPPSECLGKAQVVPPKSFLVPGTASCPLFLHDCGPAEMTFGPEGQVRGGTVKGLVTRLTSHEGVDLQFFKAFLMTYPLFTTSLHLLHLLIQRFHTAPPKALTADQFKIWTSQKQQLIRARVINAMRSWIQSYLPDKDAAAIIERVKLFCQRDLGQYSTFFKKLLLTCAQRQAGQLPLKRLVPISLPGDPPQPILPKSIRTVKLVDIAPLELARQLTLIESTLFSRIQANECLAKVWPKKLAEQGTPNIKAMIEMSNARTRWILESILSKTEQRKRAKLIKHFILTAENCRVLGNFSSLMQILAGLNSTPVYRLRQTWESLPQKVLTLFGKLNRLMSASKNYAHYRETIKHVVPPCVPFLGVYLTDWTFIGDGNPDYLPSTSLAPSPFTVPPPPPQINFNKRLQAANLVHQIQAYQAVPYHLTPVPHIAKFLDDSAAMCMARRDEAELYPISLKLEPKEKEYERVARLLADSGMM